jgi:signal transduction histidine kinase
LARKLPGLVRQGIWRLIASYRNYRTATPLQEQLLIGVIFVFGFVFAAGGFFAIQSLSRSQAQQEFQGPATQFTETLSEAIDGYLGVVSAAGTLYATIDEVDRWAFFEFARRKLPSYPGIRSLEWIPRVPADQRPSYEERASGDGLFDFQIKERNSRGEPVEAAARGEYYPIYYVEPFEGNEASLGFDLASDAAAWEHLAQARDAGTVVAMPRAKSTWKADGQPEFAIILPVYDSELVPFTTLERRDKLVGFLRGTYRLGDLIDAALPGLTVPPGLDIYLFDREATADQRLVYYHPSPLRPGPSEPLSEAEAVGGLFNATMHDVANWQWQIVVKPVPSHFTRNVNSASWGFVTFTLLLTALLVQYLVWSQNRTREIARSVDERTAALQQEIAERKRIETELRRAKEQAEVANRSKSEFLAMMSHELRTPLNAVIGFAEIMAGQFFGPIGSEQYRRYAADIHMSGKHLLSLINDILDLSKIEANRFELHEENLSLARTWSAVQSILQESVSSAKLGLEADVPSSLPCLRGDERAIRQILINLLSNAVKFTPEGGQITVKAAVDSEGRLILSVVDTGIGISEHDLKEVILPFKQVDSSLARKFEGTGLGLPLTHRLVEMHDGQLEIESTLGAGTTVQLIFPAERVVYAEPDEIDSGSPLESLSEPRLKRIGGG